MSAQHGAPLTGNYVLQVPHWVGPDFVRSACCFDVLPAKFSFLSPETFTGIRSASRSESCPCPILHPFPFIFHGYNSPINCALSYLHVSIFFLECPRDSNYQLFVQSVLLRKVLLFINLSKHSLSKSDGNVIKYKRVN